MKNEYSIERKIDKLGRVVVPRDIRKKYNIDLGSKITITAAKNGIITKAAEK